MFCILFVSFFHPWGAVGDDRSRGPSCEWRQGTVSCQRLSPGCAPGANGRGRRNLINRPAPSRRRGRNGSSWSRWTTPSFLAAPLTSAAPALPTWSHLERTGALAASDPSELGNGQKHRCELPCPSWARLRFQSAAARYKIVPQHLPRRQR